MNTFNKIYNLKVKYMIKVMNTSSKICAETILMTKPT